MRLRHIEVFNAVMLTGSVSAADQLLILHKLDDSFGFYDAESGKLEAKDMNIASGAILEKAGILVGFHTDDGVTDSRLFLREAALSVRAGMSREKALYGMTMANARILDLDKRVGSLEPGKDADVALYDGDPFEYTSHCVGVLIDGKVVSDTAR